jgi:hypothetical protein
MNCVGCQDVGCSSGEVCDYATGWCVQRGTAEIGDSCSDSTDCRDDGAICMNWPGGYCWLSCDGGEVCPSGSICQQVEDGYYCLKQCYSNSDCRPNDYVCLSGIGGNYCGLHCRYLSCGPRSDCNETTGICESIPATSGEGERCGLDYNDCQPGLECIALSEGEYYCMYPCNPQQDGFCSDGAICMMYGSYEEGVCLTGGNLREGDNCEDDPLACGKGLICVIDMGTARCRKACDPIDNDPSCELGQLCYTLQDQYGNQLPWGACL